jgi:hypothetical protein
MFKYYTLVVANAIGTAVAPAKTIHDEPEIRSRTNAWLTIGLCSIALIAALAAQISLNSWVVHHSLAYDAWHDRLPVGLLLWDDHSWHRLLLPKNAAPNIFMSIIVLIQSLALFGFAKNISKIIESAQAKYLIAGVTCILLAISMQADSLTSGDSYAYTAYGHLNTHQDYNPTPNMFSGALTPLNTLPDHLWFGLEPAPYGPLWLAIAHATIGHAPDLMQSLMIDRFINVIGFCICIASFLALRLPIGVVAVFAMNPAIIFDVIAEGHNDVIALACIFGGFALARKYQWAGTFVSAMAAFVKLPYILISLLVVTCFSKLSSRIIACVAVIALICAGSFALGGHDYIYSLTHHVTGNTVKEPKWHEALHIAIVGGACIGVFAAIFFSRYFTAATYMYPTLFAVVHPWYLLAGLPYALKCGSPFFSAFLILLPLVGFEMEIIYNPSYVSYLLFAAIVVSAVYGIWRKYIAKTSLASVTGA